MSARPWGTTAPKEPRSAPPPTARRTAWTFVTPAGPARCQNSRRNVGALCWNAVEMESTSPSGPAPYRLVRRPAPAAAPLSLDAAQQRVVQHSGGPLLVLAGPGTGKTATIVETVAHRIEHRGLDPSRVLVLTFSRKAAGELRERIAARLHRTIREPLALTFHSYAYALLRGELADGAAHWPEALRLALATRGFAEELRDFLLRAAERGLDGRRVAAL